MDAELELKPCPFCGGKDISVYEYEEDYRGAPACHYAACNDCDARGPEDYCKREAAQLWNNRVDSVPDDRRIHKEGKVRGMEKLCMWIAWRLPRRLVYWCGVRMGAWASQGKWAGDEVPGITVLTAMERWQ